MAMTTDDAVARTLDMISTIGTLSDGLAQRNAAQTKYYIASLLEVGLLTQSQFEVLAAATDAALRDWEVQHADVTPIQKNGSGEITTDAQPERSHPQGN